MALFQRTLLSMTASSSSLLTVQQRMASTAASQSQHLRSKLLTEVARLKTAVDKLDESSESSITSTYAAVEKASASLLSGLYPSLYTASIAERHLEARALHLLTEWGVADRVGDAEVSTIGLARSLNVHHHYLKAALRAASKCGVFEITEQSGSLAVKNNELSRLLQQEHPSSLVQAIQFIGDEGYRSAADLPKAAEAGARQTAFQVTYQTELDYFGYVAKPDNRWREARVGQAMKELHRALPASFATEFPWGALGEGPLVDVGGGMGASPSQIAPHYPDLQFILFDLPSTIERSRAGIERNQLLASRCKFAPGSFLENEPSKSGIPTGAQWYLVRNVLHDWDDEQVVTILKSVRAAMVHGRDESQFQSARLLVGELAVSETGPTFGDTTSLQVLSLGGGIERTAQDLEALLQQAGFKLLDTHVLGLDTILTAEIAL